MQNTEMTGLPIKALENNGKLQLLIYLLKNGETKITDIKINAANSTLYHALNALSELELIDEKRIPPVTRILHLTQDGKAVAEHLVAIEKILQAKQERETKRATSQ